MAKKSNNGPVAAEQLRLLIERIERLEEEKKGIADDIKDVFSEAKSTGFCTKTMKQIIKLRAMDENDRREAEAMLDLYKGALGMLDGTPLGSWAQKKAAPEEEAQDPEATAEEGDVDEAPAEPAAPPLTVEDARRLGAEASAAGKPVTAKAYKRDCYFIALAAGWSAAAGKRLGDGALMLKLEFIQPDLRRRDDDNLIAAFKSGRDAIAQALHIDDARFALQVHMLPPDPALLDAMGARGGVRATIEVLV